MLVTLHHYNMFSHLKLSNFEASTRTITVATSISKYNTTQVYDLLTRNGNKSTSSHYPSFYLPLLCDDHKISLIITISICELQSILTNRVFLLRVIHERFSIKCICDRKMLSFRSMYIEQRVSIKQVLIHNNRASAKLSLSGTVH